MKEITIAYRYRTEKLFNRIVAKVFKKVKYQNYQIEGMMFLSRVSEKKILEGLKTMCRNDNDEYWFALNEYVFKTPESHPRNAGDEGKVDDVICKAIRGLSDVDYQRLVKKVG